MSQSRRFEELDALRGMAALMVVLFHLTQERPQAELGFKLGITGVDLFFIISGFVIFMSVSKVKSSLDFAVIRISRLYPTYWASVTFTFLLIIVLNMCGYTDSHSIDVVKYLANMTMFQFYFDVGNLDGPYWTMITEMLFYIGILLLIRFKFLHSISSIGVVLTVGVSSVVYFGFQTPAVTEIIEIIPLLQFFPLFFAGIVFYQIHQQKEGIIKKYAVILVCFVAQVLLYDHGRAQYFLTEMEYAIMLAIYFALFILFINGRLRFIVSKVTLFLGNISFALYLIHNYTAKRVLLPFLVEEHGMNFWFATIFICIPTVIILASAITYGIDVPGRRLMKRKLRKVFF
ncbi:MAG: acyltransferase [Flavobacteriales bacterium]|nr:acyltransferase [Flavobacteriales bacterium]